MKTITKEELASKVGSPWVTIVNVLEPESYKKIHIQGSINVPRKELESGGWSKLDFTKEMVVHCSNYECDASREAARLLESKGMDVCAYEGGIKEWAEAGLPTEGEMTPRQYLDERHGARKLEASSAQ